MSLIQAQSVASSVAGDARYVCASERDAHGYWTLRCAWCASPFKARRADARTCSPSCRAKLSRSGPPSRSVRLSRRYGIEERDLWRTPPEVLHAVAAELGGPFTLDAASAGDDAVAPLCITPEQDARRTSWAAACRGRPKRVWCNPPYSRLAGGLLAWVEAAVRARDEGCDVALLLPPSISTQYWRLLCKEAPEILMCARRVAFLHPDTGIPSTGNRGESAIALLRAGQSGPAVMRPWGWQ